MKRLRTPCYEDGIRYTTTQANKKHIDYVIKRLGLENAKEVPTAGVQAHRKDVDAKETPLLSDAESECYRSCIGSLLYYVQDRADEQLEVSILGGHLKEPL